MFVGGGGGGQKISFQWGSAVFSIEFEVAGEQIKVASTTTQLAAWTRQQSRQVYPLLLRVFYPQEIFEKMMLFDAF